MIRLGCVRANIYHSGRIKAAQQRQKNWADKRRKDLHFEVGDHVFLKVASRRGLRKSNKLGKLNPRLAKRISIKTHTLYNNLPIDSCQVCRTFSNYPKDRRGCLRAEPAT